MEAIWICIVDVAGISNAHIRAWATDADRAEQLREQDLDMVEYRPASDIDRITAERDGYKAALELIAGFNGKTIFSMEPEYRAGANAAYEQAADIAIDALTAPPLAHASDCAVHNAPALPVGPCDCGTSSLSDAQS